MNTVQSAEQRDNRLHALIASYLDCEAAGRSPERAAWLAAHPEFAEELALFLDEHERLGRVGAPFRVLAAGAGDGLLTIAEAGAEQSTREVQVVRNFGDYELLQEIARGGMGVVFKARQKSLDRVVALKMILAGQLASKTDLERFRLEAHAAANLDHPQIVPIYEIGEQDGQHYFTMKLIDGPALTEFAARLDVKARQRWAAHLVASVARAVHHAHQRGILHRDLKPGNILLDAPDLNVALRLPETALPHVTDFGLAKRVDDDVAITHTGAVVGTPAYMAPEQARAGRQLTTAVDIYSLGAILYELLTGQPPFRGDNVIELMRYVTDHEPARPSSVNAAVELDLETISLKCLEKAPERRYRSAEALADDLERWLAGEPIEARPATAWERTVKWARRRPAVAALLSVSILCAAVLLIGGTIFNAHLQIALGQVQAKQHDLNEAEVYLDQAQKALGNAKTAVARQEQAARQANTLAQKLLAEAKSLRLVAHSQMVRPTEPALALLLALEGAKLAPRQAEQNNALAQALAECREVGPLLSADDGHDVRWVHWFADGRILTISWSNVRVWDAKSGQKLLDFDGPKLRINSFAISPDEQWLALTFENHWEHNVVEINGKMERAAFLVTDQAVRIYDLKTGLELQVLRGHRHQVVSAAFSPDGQRLVTASRDCTARVWDVATGTQLKMLEGHECGVAWAGFTADDRVLTASSGEKTSKQNDPLQKLIDRYPAAAVDPRLPTPFRAMAGGASLSGSGGQPVGEALFACLWDANTGARIKEYRTAARGQFDFPRAARLDRFGSYLVAIDLRNSMLLKAAAVNDGAVKWDDVTPKEKLALKNNTDSVHPPLFSRDGKRALLVFPAAVRVFELVTGQEIAALHADSEDFTTACFSPDAEGQFVVTASKDKTARLWESAGGRELFVLRGHDQPVLAATFSPDGRRVVTGADDRTARIWNVELHHEYARNIDPASRNWWFGPGARHIITATNAGAALNSRKAIWSAAVSPNGKQLATGSFDGTLRLWDFATGRLLATRRGYEELESDQLRERLPGEIFAIRYNQDGSRLLTVAADPVIRVLDSKSKHIPGARPGFPFTPVRIYDTASGKRIAALELPEPVRSAEFSCDGSRILTVADYRIATVSLTKSGAAVGGGSGGGADKSVRIFDAATGKQLHIFNGPWKEIHSACWDSTGERICTVGNEPDQKGWNVRRMARIWDVKTGKDTHTFFHAHRNMTSAQFSADGRKLLTWHDTRIRQSTGSTQTSEACVWDLATGDLTYTMTGTAKSANSAAFSPDGKWIATGSYVYSSSLSGGRVGVHGRLRDLYYADRTARLWNAETGALVHVLYGHERSVHHLEFSKDSRWLVTASEDRTARVWDVTAGNQVITLRGHDDDVKTATFTPDAAAVLTTSWDGTARLWPVDPMPIAQARRPRSLSEEERHRYGVDSRTPRGQ